MLPLAITSILWFLLFHFLGNSTFGYTDTNSLFGWLDYDYGMKAGDEHGYLVPIAFLALLYMERDRLRAIPRKPNWLPIILLIAGVVIHLLGYRVQQVRISVIGFFIGWYGIIGLTCGLQLMRAIFFPYVLFVFCFPLGTLADTISFPLRLMATTITATVSHILGVDVVQVGTMLFNKAKGYEYEVAAACSGLRSLIATLFLSTIYAFLTFKDVKTWQGLTWRRIVLILSAFPLAVAANVFRLMMIIFAAEIWGQKGGAYVHDSSVLSMLPYIPAFLGMMVVAWLISPRKAVTDSDSEISEDFDDSKEIAKEVIKETSPVPPAIPLNVPDLFQTRWILVGVCGILCVTAVICWHFKMHQTIGKPGVEIVAGELFDENNNLVRTNMVKLPEICGSFSSKPLPVSTQELNWLPSDTTYGRRRYVSAIDNFTGDLSVVLMEKDRTSIHKPQYCLPGQGLQITKEETIELPVTLKDGSKLRTQLIHAGQTIQMEDGSTQPIQALYYYFFVADGQTTPNHSEMMMRIAKGLLFQGVTERWGYISFFTWFRPEQEKLAMKRSSELLEELLPQVMNDAKN